MTEPPSARADRQGTSAFIRPLLFMTAGFLLGCIVTAGYTSKRKHGSGPAGRMQTSASNTNTADNTQSETLDRESSHDGPTTRSKDPVKTIRAVFLNSNLTGREIAFARMMGEMTPENAMRIRELFFEFDRSGIKSDNEWRMFWHQWAVVDPEGALGQIQEEAKNPEQGYAAGVMANIFSIWAATDPTAAKNALGRIENHWDYEASYLGLVRGLGFQDADSFAKGSQFEDPAFAAKVAEALADRVLRESNSVESMKAWYESLSGNLKTGALDHVYWRTKVASLDDAAAWMKQNSDKGIRNPRIMGEIALDYTRKEPLKGLEWYVSLPDEEISIPIAAQLRDSIGVDSQAYKELRARNPRVRQFLHGE